MSKERASAALDADSKAMLYEGCSISQLAVIWKMDKRDITSKIGTLAPAGHRSGYPIYHIRDVAKKLWKPDEEEIERLMKTIAHQDLPKIFSKEYWAGLRSRQEYELRAGELWPTAKVVEEVAELMKTFKMSSLLMMDAVERETELSEKQREIIRSLTEGMLEDCASIVQRKFTNPEPAQIGQEQTDDDAL
jgi:hypothetical protein